MQYRDATGSAVGNREVTGFDFPALNRDADGPGSGLPAGIHVDGNGDAHWPGRAERKTARHARYRRWLGATLEAFAWLSPDYTAWCISQGKRP